MQTAEERRAVARAYYLANKEKLNALARAQYARNRETVKASSREYRASNIEKLKAFRKAKYAANCEALRTASREAYANDPESAKAYQAAHRKAHPGKWRAWGAKHHAAKLQRTAPWADLAAIREIYETALPGEHVDHIIPLQGALVSGLHVENNLQHLDATENLSKSNAFNPWTHVHILPGE